MPVMIPSQYASGSGLGDAISQLGESLFGANSLKAGVMRENMISKRRENDNVPLLADAVVAGDKTGMARHGVLSGQDPKFTAGYGQFNDVSKFGPNSEQGLRATMAVPGANYGSTMQGVNADLANRRAITQMQVDKAYEVERMREGAQPINVIDPQTGQPRIVSRAEAIRAGAKPVLSAADSKGYFAQSGFGDRYGGWSDEQKRAAGVDEPPGKALNYYVPDAAGRIVQAGVTLDNQTDSVSGAALPQGWRAQSPVNPSSIATLSPAAPHQKMIDAAKQQIVNNNDLASLAERMHDLVAKDPTIVGIPGEAQKYGQNAMDALRATVNAFGKGSSVEQSINNVRSEALAKYGGNVQRLMPELFKSNISELEFLHGLAVYKAAEGLLGQTGRDLSDKDVAMARSLTGDPASWMRGPQDFLTKMQTLSNYARSNSDAAKRMLEQSDIWQRSSGQTASPPPQNPPPPRMSIEDLKQKYGLQ